VHQTQEMAWLPFGLTDCVRGMLGVQVSISSTFYMRFFANILEPKNSKPKHSFVIFGAKILVQNVHLIC